MLRLFIFGLVSGLLLLSDQFPSKFVHTVIRSSIFACKALQGRVVVVVSASFGTVVGYLFYLQRGGIC